MDYSGYLTEIIRHYETAWKDVGQPLQWDKGPVYDLPQEFTVLEFPPRHNRAMWTYATACMSLPIDIRRIELHLFSPERTLQHCELLTIIAHYHRTEAKLDLCHTVYFGKPWMPGSQCDHGLISLPYLDGPELEVLAFGGKETHFLWLIPITRREVEYKKSNGLEALETAFEKKHFNYLDPFRGSVA